VYRPAVPYRVAAPPHPPHEEVDPPDLRADELVVEMDVRPGRPLEPAPTTSELTLTVGALVGAMALVDLLLKL
jgi:hypothetical protein